MAILNFFLQLSTYSDKKASNSPNLSNFKWVRDIAGVPVDNPSSQTITIPANTSMTIFTGANKKLVYVESDKDANLTVNGVAVPTLKPYVIGSSTQPGTFLLKSTITSLAIANPSLTDPIVVFVAAAE